MPDSVSSYLRQGLEGQGRGMKNIYRFMAFCFLLAVLLCSGHPAQVQAAVGLNHTSAVICIGGRVELKLNGTDEPVTWTTSNKKIATVGSAGVVTGVNKGKASITAQAGGKKYSCLVTVNETYGASVSSVTIKRQETVMLTFTKDAVVSYKIKDTDICSASWGSWDGNEIPLLITPKKVGTTYITCSNGANNETVRIRVKVKKVPVNVTDIQAVTSDGGDFVCGENTLQISFKQDRTSRNTVLYIIGRNGETVSTMKLGVVPARRTYYTFWDGKNDLGVNFEGEFRIKIVADGYTVRKWHYYESYASSPFAGGDGTKERPYQVATAGHLLKMPDFNGRHFIQVRDIDLRSEIIGSLFSAEEPFRGSYNAKPHEINYRILYFNSNTSLFGTIGAEGELDNVIIMDARVTGTGQERAAVLAEVNLGTVTGCTIEQAVIYSASSTDAALLAVENSGVIDRCKAHGTVYTYGSMSGGVVYNHQRMTQTDVEAGLNLSAAGGITSAQELFIGGVAAVNGQLAFIDACASSCSIQASGTLKTPAKLYMGGIAGKNLGQVRDGSALGDFPLENTNNLIGESHGGVIAGENEGMITGVIYYETVGRKSSATGNGRESSLNPLKNQDEEA